MGGMDTQAENPSHRLHRCKTTVRSCYADFFPSVLCLHSRVIQQLPGSGVLLCENTSYGLSRYMILLTIQQQYLTDVAMTCFSLRL